jgi:hypothetical protein
MAPKVLMVSRPRVRPRRRRRLGNRGAARPLMAAALTPLRKSEQFPPLQVAEKPSIALSIASALSGGRVSAPPPPPPPPPNPCWFWLLVSDSGVTWPRIHLGMCGPALTFGAPMGVGPSELLVVWSQPNFYRRSLSVDCKFVWWLLELHCQGSFRDWLKWQMNLFSSCYHSEYDQCLSSVAWVLLEEAWLTSIPL